MLILGFARLGMATPLPPTYLTPPIWISDYGTQITSWTGNADDGFTTVTFPAGFVFPFFVSEVGSPYSSAVVSTNGSIYFGGLPGNSQPSDTTASLLQGLPRIAAAWYNIDTLDGNGQIYVNTSLPGKVVFTWVDVGSYPEGQTAPASNRATFQVTLDSDGTIIFAYAALNLVARRIQFAGLLFSGYYRGHGWRR